MPTSATAPTRGRLREYTTGQPAPVRVDAEKGVLYDVLILGHNSRNRAEYSQAVMQEALVQYEGATVFVGHTKDGSNPDYDRRMGVQRNVRVTAEGIRGDFHFNPKHRLAEQLVWDAQNAPAQVGFSHDADCEFQVRNGRRVVTKIDRVFSVDLVTRPATTRGLFEDEESLIESDPALKQLAEDGLAAMDNARSIIFADDMPLETKRTRLCEALAEWQTELTKNDATPTPASGTLKEETNMGVEYKDMTVESITKERPDLADLLRGTHRMTEEVAALKATVTAKDAELATLKTERAARLKEEEIAAELKAATFPVTDAVVFSTKFQEQLSAASDKTARAALIADRMELAKGRMQEDSHAAPPLGEMRPDPIAAPADKASEKRLFGS